MMTWASVFSTKRVPHVSCNCLIHAFTCTAHSNMSTASYGSDYILYFVTARHNNRKLFLD